MKQQSERTNIIRLLGPVEIVSNDQHVILRRKTKAVLAYLAVTQRTHHRVALCDMFCQQADDPRQTLRLILSRIRRQLGPQMLLTSNQQVQINAEFTYVDSWYFERELSNNTHRLPPQVLTEVLRRYRGELLADLTLRNAPEFELWLLSERFRFRQLYEQGLKTLLTYLIDQQAYQAAIPWATELVSINPLDQQAHTHLMWLLSQVQTGKTPSLCHQSQASIGF